jgi:putative membrane protein
MASRSGFSIVNLLITWLVSALAVWLSAKLIPGVRIESFGVALVAAVVLGLVNALVRPLLVVLTLPITVVTLGLFLLVVNAATVGLAAYMIQGFTINGLFPAIFFSLVLTLVSWVLESVSSMIRR